MWYKHLIIVFCNLITLLLATPVAAQDDELPRTDHGLPDLQGVWNFYTRTPLERSLPRSSNNQSAASTPAVPSVGAYNGFWNERDEKSENTRASLIVYPPDGRIPPVNPGVQIQHGGDITSDFPIPGTRPVRYTHGGIGRDGPEDRGLSERCLSFFTGPPLLSSYYNNHIQIIQNADHVVILVEMGFDARIVPLHSRPPLDSAVRLWSGDSRGYFDGDTLVVETRNFSTQVASLGLRAIAYGSSENRLLTERFTPTGPETMDYEFTIDDPTTFTDTIIGILPMSRVEDRLYEYACHAGNYAMGNILRAARRDEITR